MSGRPIISREEQTATFIELFFDLVFVFSVTQVVGLLHGGLTWASAGQALLVFWLVWWAWTQFTWALNAADTTHPWVELGTLLATAVAFFMAVALPDAFAGRALWFALAYVLVKVIGLTLYIWVAWTDEAMRAAVRRFALVSLGGLAAVLAGGIVGGGGGEATGGPWQYLLWGLAIVLDIVAANIGGQTEGWVLHPAHFAERHGLFVIIALGESLIVAASSATGAAWSGALAAVATLSVALACALWWTYFPRALPALEHAARQRRGAARAQFFRDVYSLLHFPMLCGVVLFAFAVEEAVAHPADPLPFATRLALGLGLFLFVGGLGVALRRANGRLPGVRLLLSAATAAVVLVWAGVAPALSLGVAFLGVAVVALVEQVQSETAGDAAGA